MNHDEPTYESGGRGRPPRNPNFRVIFGGEEEMPSSAPERSPPHSAEAEEHVLACCMLEADGSVVARCLREKLQPEAFYFPACRLLFEILVALHTTSRPTTIEVLAEELKSRRQLDAVGGFHFLMQVTGKSPTTAHAGYFIETVRTKAILRKLILLGSDLVEKVYDFKPGRNEKGEPELEAFVSRHSLRIQRVADFVTRFNRPGPAEEAAAAKQQLAEILAGKVDKTRQLSLGTAYADQVLFKLDVKNEDWLVIVAGPPSGGKSSLMRQLALENARAGKRGAVFLLETGKRRWQWAMAASAAGANLREILEEPQRVLPEKLRSFQEWDDAITAWMGERLWIHDELVYLEDIERTVRELDRTLREQDLAAARTPEAIAAVRGLDYVVIDYLQLMPTRENKIFKREEQVAYLSRTLKRLFKSVNISGIVGAQLNRKSRDEERRPRLSDLRESGAIEQDADCVLAVHTPAVDRSGANQDGDRSVHEIELIQLKRRNGPANVAVDLLFFKAQTRFQDAVRKGDARPGAPKPTNGYKREGGQ